ncbi:MAG TPA: hypothetical protein VGO52_24130 [Hyphomonadaceae bacterium]|jgi:hypothetical protein|nr:hypothetical protein [Hyphomonadaceae bacterium]
MVDPAAQAILAPLLAQGETLLWAAPVNAKAQARAALPRALYALALLAFALIVIWTTASILAQAYDLDLSYALAAAIPGAIAIAAILGAVHQFGILYRGRNAAYGLTARRVLAATAGPKQARISVPVSRITSLHADGGADAGTLVLTAAPEDARASNIGLSLLSIRNADKVEALLLDLIAPRKAAP